jgi:tetratricopeptide (TPR) repeat protein
VAWISERKDVLSALFWILTMGAYVGYVRRGGSGRYLLTLLLFALGLMAKPMLVTLPLVLLLLDYWPLERLSAGDGGVRWKTIWPLVREKILFLALSVIFGIATFVVQQGFGAVASVHAVRPVVRVAGAVVCYVDYLNKLLWPADLAVFYPLRGTIWAGRIAWAALLLAGVSVFVFRLASRYRYLAVGWLWYLVTLLPVIGLLQTGDQSMADRYSYMPFTGLFIMIAWGLPDLLEKSRRNRIVLAVSAAVVLAAFSVRTASQVRHWRNSVTLFEHALEVTEGNFVAYNQLGAALYYQGRYEDALTRFRRALEIFPEYDAARENLAKTRARISREKTPVDGP